ncbi:MAG: DUF86 domain-containing protein [Nanoarchaeales archaeon]|nr:DUF86 domain-containing protein [Nanoarchaeales archaeon]
MQRKSSLFLSDILSSIDKIKTYTKDLTFNDFISSELHIDAVTRNFEIIGEAVSYLPKELIKTYSHIPWRTIKDLRNTVIHQYWKVDYEIEWEIIQNKLDELEEQIKEIIELEKKK